MTDLDSPEKPESESESTPLGRFLSGAKQEAERGGVSEAEKRVEALLAELGVPFKTSPSGDEWEIASDVGDVSVALNDGDDMLSFWHVVGTIARKPSKKQSEYLWTMLTVNMSTHGACIAISDEADGFDPAIVVIGRLSATDIDKSEIELVLEDVFQTLEIFYAG